MRLFFIFFLLLLKIEVKAQTDVLKDPRDGHEYKTVQIGTQTWMAENLDYRPYLMLLSNWADTSKPADIFCYNDDTTNCKRYGALYRHKALKNACPTGWRLPTEVVFQIGYALN